MLTSLAVFGYTGLELTGTGSDDENSTVGLGGSSDHVLNEIAVTRGI